MISRAIQSVLFVWCLLAYSEVESRKLSKKEDLELEKQFKLMNKPAVQTIRTTYGDIYNCVDFYQQPVFDHPLLKNHTFNFKRLPSFISKRGRDENKSTSVFDSSTIWLNGKGCPIGTVPINKITKSDLVRAKLASKTHAPKFSLQTSQVPGLHLAIIRTRNGPNKKYYGGGMSASLHNLTVKDSQSSYARMKIQNGADYIEAGWMVNPTMYKDSRTRMYIYTSAGQSRCFNTFCPGFVHVASDIPLDYAFNVKSKPGGPIYSATFVIDRDQMPGNWYLSVADGSKVVGFWNHGIFKTGLNNFATYIDWGGQVYGPTNVPSAPMGSGGPFKGNSNYDAYFFQVTYANETYHLSPNNDVEQFSDVHPYTVKDVGHRGAEIGYAFLYGGEGGYTGN